MEEQLVDPFLAVRAAVPEDGTLALPLGASTHFEAAPNSKNEKSNEYGR